MHEIPIFDVLNEKKSMTFYSTVVLLMQQNIFHYAVKSPPPRPFPQTWGKRPFRYLL